MEKVFTIHRAKSNFSKIVEMAESGQTVTIARGKAEPTVAVVPFKQAHGKRVRVVKHLAEAVRYKKDADLMEPLPADFHGDLS